jgi:hypothetical protein
MPVLPPLLGQEGLKIRQQPSCPRVQLQVSGLSVARGLWTAQFHVGTQARRLGLEACHCVLANRQSSKVLEKAFVVALTLTPTRRVIAPRQVAKVTKHLRRVAPGVGQVSETSITLTEPEQAPGPALRVKRTQDTSGVAQLVVGDSSNSSITSVHSRRRGRSDGNKALVRGLVVTRDVDDDGRLTHRTRGGALWGFTVRDHDDTSKVGERLQNRALELTHVRCEIVNIAITLRFVALQAVLAPLPPRLITVEA